MHGRGHYNIWLSVTINGQVNKSGAHHCSKCNACMVGLDHHCQFVNNCVGIGNRRVFVLFAAVTALSCLTATAITIYDPTPTPCGNLLSMNGQYCHFVKFPMIFFSLWMNIAVSTFTGGIMISQLQLVAAETTTLEVLRGTGHPNDCQSRNLRKSLENICKFVLTAEIA